MNSRSEKIFRLVKEYERAGALLRVDFHYDQSSDELLVTTKEPLQVGQCLAAIPIDRVIHCESVFCAPSLMAPFHEELRTLLRNVSLQCCKDDDENGADDEELEHFTQKLAIQVFLLIERAAGDASAFASYLSALPEHVDLPLVWDQSSLRLLAHTELEQCIYSEMERLRRAYRLLFGDDEHGEGALSRLLLSIFANANLSPLIAATDYFSEASFFYVHCVFKSRCMGVIDRRYDQKRQPFASLVPVVDLFDHDPDARVNYMTWTNEGMFGLEACASHAAGVRVYSNYSRRTNSELLRNYGFLLPDNADDGFSVQLIANVGGGEEEEGDGDGDGDDGDGGDDESFGDRNERLEILKQRHATHGWQLKHIVRQGIIDASLMHSMRIMLLNAMELYFYDYNRLVMAREPVGSVGEAICVVNEQRVCRVLRRILARRLARLCDESNDVVIEAEQALLSGALLDERVISRIGLGIMYRSSQQRMLATAVHNVDAYSSSFHQQYVPMIDSIERLIIGVGGDGDRVKSSNRRDDVISSHLVHPSLQRYQLRRLSPRTVYVVNSNESVAQNQTLLSLPLDCLIGAHQFCNYPRLLHASPDAIGYDLVNLAQRLIAQGFDNEDLVILLLLSMRAALKKGIVSDPVDGNHLERFVAQHDARSSGPLLLYSISNDDIDEVNDPTSFANRRMRVRAALRGTALLRDIDVVGAQLREHHQSLIEAYVSFGGLASDSVVFRQFDEFLWALTLINTHRVNERVAQQIGHKHALYGSSLAPCFLTPLDTIPLTYHVETVEQRISDDGLRWQLESTTSLPRGAVVTATDVGDRYSGHQRSSMLLFLGFSYQNDALANSCYLDVVDVAVQDVASAANVYRVALLRCGSWTADVSRLSAVAPTLLPLLEQTLVVRNTHFIHPLDPSLGALSRRLLEALRRIAAADAATCQHLFIDDHAIDLQSLHFYAALCEYHQSRMIQEEEATEEEAAGDEEMQAIFAHLSHVRSTLQQNVACAEFLIEEQCKQEAIVAIPMKRINSNNANGQV